MFVAYENIVCTLKRPSLTAKIGKAKKSWFGRIDSRGQFHQRSTLSFYIRKLCMQLFCAYFLGLYFTGARLLAQKLRVECWWNWPQAEFLFPVLKSTFSTLQMIFDILKIGNKVCRWKSNKKKCRFFKLTKFQFLVEINTAIEIFHWNGHLKRYFIRKIEDKDRKREWGQ